MQVTACMVEEAGGSLCPALFCLYSPPLASAASRAALAAQLKRDTAALAHVPSMVCSPSALAWDCMLLGVGLWVCLRGRACPLWCVGMRPVRVCMRAEKACLCCVRSLYTQHGPENHVAHPYLLQVTIFALDGRVLHQNGRSLSYFGYAMGDLTPRFLTVHSPQVGCTSFLPCASTATQRLTLLQDLLRRGTLLPGFVEADTNITCLPAAQPLQAVQAGPACSQRDVGHP